MMPIGIEMTIAATSYDDHEDQPNAEDSPPTASNEVPAPTEPGYWAFAFDYHRVGGAEPIDPQPGGDHGPGQGQQPSNDEQCLARGFRPVASQLRESADYYHHDAYDECCADSDRNHYTLSYEQDSHLEGVRVAFHHVHVTANVVSRNPEDNGAHGDYREHDVGKDEDCSKHRERRLFGREEHVGEHVCGRRYSRYRDELPKVGSVHPEGLVQQRAQAPGRDGPAAAWRDRHGGEIHPARRAESRAGRVGRPAVGAGLRPAPRLVAIVRSLAEFYAAAGAVPGARFVCASAVFAIHDASPPSRDESPDFPLVRGNRCGLGHPRRQHRQPWSPEHGVRQIARLQVENQLAEQLRGADHALSAAR